MSVQLRSFAKINVGLAVGPARPDGYHGLTTVYQTIALHDEVRVTAQRAGATRIEIDADHPWVPSTARGNAERNTAYRMVAGALERLGTQAEVRVEIRKRLPVQGGLGAGSANAAAALLGLERELGEALPGPERLLLAGDVGSDVALFLVGGTVLGVGRGEEVFPLPDAGPLPVVIAVPGVGVSTAAAFRDLDAAMAAGTQRLTEPSEHHRLKELGRALAAVWTPTGVGRKTTGIAHPFPPPPGVRDLPSARAVSGSFREQKGDLAENPLLTLVRAGIENDFESVAFGQHSSLREIKNALLGVGLGSSGTRGSAALYASLSGSGSALFGIYGSTEAAIEAQQRVQSLGTRALVTQTLSRREYWQQMFA